MYLSFKVFLSVDLSVLGIKVNFFQRTMLLDASVNIAKLLQKCHTQNPLDTGG